MIPEPTFMKPLFDMNTGVSIDPQGHVVKKDKVKDTALCMFPYLGSKVRVIPEIERHMPKSRKMIRYVDPFMGGGSVILNMIHKSLCSKVMGFREFYGFDNNSELLIVYNTIIKHTDRVVCAAHSLQTLFNKTVPSKRVNIYNIVCDRYSNMPEIPIQDVYDIPVSVTLASRFLFLVETTFGRFLTRRKDGQISKRFNKVDYEIAAKSLNLKLNRIQHCAELLRHAKLGYGDFSEADDMITDHTFLYLDPPYVKTDKTLAVVAYFQNKKFTMEDQYRLRDFMLKHTDTTRAMIMMSNTGHSDGAAVVADIYQDFNMYKILVDRRIGVAAKARKSDKPMTTKLTEYIITNYNVDYPSPLFSGI